MNKLLINTPQNVNLEYKLASLGSRVIAFAIDYGIIIVYSILIFSILSIGIDKLDSWSAMGLISLFTLPIIFYPMIFETMMQGQTIGKKIMKIKVVKIDGTRATIYQYFIRWISNTVDIILSMGGIGMTSIILSQKSQRLGDMAADTTVISIKDDMNLKDTLYQEITEEHQIVYPEVIRLTDHDLNTIKEIFNMAHRRKNYQIIQALAAKLELLLDTIPDVTPQDFVQQVIKDHYYMFREQ